MPSVAQRSALVVASVLATGGVLAPGVTTRAKEGAPRASSAPDSGRPAANTARLFRIVGCASRGGAPYRHGPRAREVALGFDDGPATDTAAFVSVLERAHSPATFFVVGRLLGWHDRGLLLRELRDGDAIG